MDWWTFRRRSTLHHAVKNKRVTVQGPVKNRRWTICHTGGGASGFISLAMAALPPTPSPAQILCLRHEVGSYEKEWGSNKSTYWVVFELIWRDYFRFFAMKHGNKIFFPHGPSGDAQAQKQEADVLERCALAPRRAAERSSSGGRVRVEGTQLTLQGAVGSGYPSVHCPITGGSGQWVSLMLTSTRVGRHCTGVIDHRRALRC